uniref:Uncharacterized protein n=1 Tax=Vespula pensylvanica TaxID=30213 RepID=A0A834P441_VESPE|nr:hypothetical protein H0235_007000 [Vespula pensylvanica]
MASAFEVERRGLWCHGNRFNSSGTFQEEEEEDEEDDEGEDEDEDEDEEDEEDKEEEEAEERQNGEGTMLKGRTQRIRNFFKIHSDWSEPCNYAWKKTGPESDGFRMDAFLHSRPPLVQIRSCAKIQ